MVGRALQPLVRGFCSNNPKTKLVRKPSFRDGGSSHRSLPEKVAARWALLVGQCQHFVQQRVPEMAKSAKAWSLAKMREVRQDPRVLVVWTSAGYGALKGFLHHMWVGSKLLATNTRIATRLLSRASTGKQLTRSQQKLLVRTSSDLLRLIPFSFFILIPFMELLLPVALKVFPNMIPSTFETTGQRESQHKKQLAVKLKLAAQLRDVMLERVHLVSLDDDKEKSNEAVEFAVFLEKMKRGVPMSKSDITRAASFFRDEFTIDGASRQQLNAMAELMNIGVPTYAPIELLRFQIRRNLRIIQADDRAISWEGVANLSHEDLVEANEQRGMPSAGLTDDQLRKQLNRWLLLSMNNAVPPSLLILSRTFVLTNDQSRFLDGTAIASAIKSIPRDVVEDIQEELMEEELEKSNKRHGAKSDEETLEELQAADAKATEESAKLDEMVEQDRVRTDLVASFQIELADMQAALQRYEERLEDMDSTIAAALAEHQQREGAQPEVLESRLGEKIRLEQAVARVQAQQEEFKERLAGVQGEVHSTSKRAEKARDK